MRSLKKKSDKSYEVKSSFRETYLGPDYHGVLFSADDKVTTARF